MPCLLYADKLGVFTQQFEQCFLLLNLDYPVPPHTLSLSAVLCITCTKICQMSKVFESTPLSTFFSYTRKK